MTMPDTSVPQSNMGTEPQLPSQTAPKTTAREQVREIKDQAIGQARDTFRDARDRVASSLGDSKTRMADQVGGMASAIRHASEQFRSDEQARLAGLVDTVATQVDQFANYLRNHDGRAMLDDIDSLARRQPALVIGGALALGLLAGRFITSSERRQSEPSTRSGDGGLYGV